MDKAPRQRKAVLIGIAGGTGSGKTLVAQRLRDSLGEESVTILQQDWYYRDLSHLPPEIRERQNFDHPDAIEHELLIEHVRQLLSGEPAEAPVYDFCRHCRTGERQVIPARPVILLEGIFVLHDRNLRELMDLRVYVDTDPDVRFVRRLQRDLNERGRTLDSVVRQYLETVRPMHLQFVEPSRWHADIIIPGGGENRLAIEVLSAWIRNLLATRPEMTTKGGAGK
ncbi:MAG: uridine kinase [candidate division KSB1 bacterium]|nr:uridine kinase [candidate division KSB1 bacterium]